MPHSRCSDIARCFGTLLLLGGVTAAMAQSIRSETDSHGHNKITNIDEGGPAVNAERVSIAAYKQTDAGRRFSYGDGTDGATTAPPPQAVERASSDVVSALARNTAMSSRRVAIIDASEAMRRLVQAREERARGVALLPGEDRSVAASPGAVIGRYQMRQNLLEGRVQSAQLRVNSTLR